MCAAPTRPEAANQEPAREYPSVLARGAVLKGDLTASEGLRICGTVEGSITSTHDVRVELGATVKGDVKARHLVVLGAIEGKVQCSEWLVLERSGRILGDVRTVHFRDDDGFIRGSIVLEGRSGKSEA